MIKIIIRGGQIQRL